MQRPRGRGVCQPDSCKWIRGIWRVGGELGGAEGRGPGSEAREAGRQGLDRDGSVILTVSLLAEPSLWPGCLTLSVPTH